MKQTALAARAIILCTKVFLRNARISVIFDHFVIFFFFYTGKLDWIIHLNVESKETILKWSIVNGSFFQIRHRQITFQAIK